MTSGSTLMLADLKIDDEADLDVGIELSRRKRAPAAHADPSPQVAARIAQDELEDVELEIGSGRKSRTPNPAGDTRRR